MNENEEIKQPEPPRQIKHEFKVPRFDKDEKPILNGAGEQVYDTYIYDFDLLGINRKTYGKTYFTIALKELSLAPQTESQLQIIANRQSEIYGLAAILIKRNDDGSLERYKIGQTYLSDLVLDFLGRGVEDGVRLEECKWNFFDKTGLSMLALISQSNSIMQQSQNIISEIQKGGGSSGLKEINQVLKFATALAK